jgi:hypothetical protein
MRHRLPTALTTAIPTALLVLAIGAGCSSDPETPTDEASTGAEATPTAPESTAESVDPATDPNSPFVVAASAAATRSVDQVIQLHSMGVATTGQSGDFPTEQIPLLAKAITSSLGELITSATLMTPPKDSAAAELITALKSYKTLSQELRNWDAAGDPMPTSWFDRLGTTDDDWKSSLEALGELSDTDLLADLPTLLMPEPE